MRTRIIAVALLCLAVNGCTVGPHYKRPAIDVPTANRDVSETADKTQTASLADTKWWDLFQDQQLQQLIRTALEQNYDVRIAATRILEAQAQLGITRANQFPTAQCRSIGGHATQCSLSRYCRSRPTAAQNRLSLSAAWELDFWGKFRRATEAARANLLASEWAKQQVISTLVSDVATAYFQLRELDLELEISQQTLVSRRDSLKLTQLLADHGATSHARREAGGTAGLHRSRAGARSATAHHATRKPAEYIARERIPAQIPRGLKLTEQPHAPQVPAGLPSALLDRRPDIRQAEEQLVAFNAQIGVAKAAYFPQITLTADGGYSSAGVDEPVQRACGILLSRRIAGAADLCRWKNSLRSETF